MKYKYFGYFQLWEWDVADICSFTDYRHVHQVHILVTCVSYHVIVKWKESEFDLWVEQGEYGPNLISVEW